jgi:hypothetical protein
MSVAPAGGSCGAGVAVGGGVVGVGGTDVAVGGPGVGEGSTVTGGGCASGVLTWTSVVGVGVPEIGCGSVQALRTIETKNKIKNAGEVTFFMADSFPCARYKNNTSLFSSFVPFRYECIPFRVVSQFSIAVQRADFYIQGSWIIRKTISLGSIDDKKPPTE